MLIPFPTRRSHRDMDRPTPIGWEKPADDPPAYKLPPLPVYAPCSVEEHLLRNAAYSASRYGINPAHRSTRAHEG